MARVAFIQPIIATKHEGITVGEAHFADGAVIRFRVLSRDPPAVQLVRGGSTEQRNAIEAWLGEGLDRPGN